jgi:hypothetical protein
VRLFLIILLSVNMSFIGCGQKENEKVSRPKENINASDQVIASVGGWQVTVSQFRETLKGLKDTAQEHNLDINNPIIRRRFLDQMVRKEILYQAGKLLGIGQDPQLKEMPEAAQKDAISQVMHNTLMKDVQVTENDMQQFYQQNQDAFSLPFSEAKDAIEGEIERAILQAKIAELLQRFEDEISVSVNYDLLDKI